MRVSAPVPRYFLHLYNDRVSKDHEGVELPDQAAARQRAILSARDIAAAEVMEGHLNLDHRIEIADEAGRVLETITFADAVKMESGPTPKPSQGPSQPA